MAAAAAWLMAGSAMAGAFGVEMGTPLSQLRDAKLFNGSGPVKNYSITVPQPNAEFSRYVVGLTPETGVCSLVGFGRLYPNDGYGTTVISSYQRLRTALIAKYGPPISEDEVPPDTLSNGDSSFAVSIFRRERKVTVKWKLNDGPDDVAALALLITSDATNATSVMIAYGFRNKDICDRISVQGDSTGF
ncbi:CRISPR-associated protein [Asticcacaulis biprosthecium C19]|uniref:CRISPR-associated protein n=1 Tax=Asticcacaulis biprosthecium C19 TaxID=715226 RepID=F4QHE6_9CAUL|nr:hypothetical protein [Asticcacaulis biprosthecium]EGF92683.1 CRISPR-associated protein [Asticcacaulis biprosthecium C19]